IFNSLIQTYSAVKQLLTFIASLFLITTILYSCQKDDIRAESAIDDSDAIGRPTSQPPYVLDTNPTQLQVYGVWHAGNDYCTWGTVRDMDDFDLKNHWIIDRGGGSPSVNVVVLSFVNPLKLLNRTNDATTTNGLPKGMTQQVVDYFKIHGIRVMLSIGGITYTKDWNTALAQNPRLLAENAAEVARTLGVGIEIDYEENRNPNLTGLQNFISTYRSIHPYDSQGTNHAARLTIDLAAGDRWLIGICQKATAEWLTTSTPVLDYANAMVPARQPSLTEAITNWDEHIDGKPQYAPPIPPLAPCKFTGALYMTGNQTVPECDNFDSSIQFLSSNYVTRIKHNGAGTSSGMLGYMFWAAECNSTRQLCTTNCSAGIGQGAFYFDIDIPMQALRQQ
ncbi:MAG TPA: hypothetical protein VLB74_08075, partial [Flavobacterium sp.]|uniref:hypothetical protein n=1 Tax=Flavobacterium sp. TaxID=239 RepID=UPI002BAB739B